MEEDDEPKLMNYDNLANDVDNYRENKNDMDQDETFDFRKNRMKPQSVSNRNQVSNTNY